MFLRAGVGEVGLGHLCFLIGFRKMKSELSYTFMSGGSFIIWSSLPKLGFLRKTFLFCKLASSFEKDLHSKEQRKDLQL